RRQSNGVWEEWVICRGSTLQQSGASQFLSHRPRNTKHPTPSSREDPNLKTPNPKNRCRGKRRAGRLLSLELGASLEPGVWNLELVARALSFSIIQMRPSRLHASRFPFHAGCLPSSCHP